jgi:hypothetical protein
MRLTGHDDGGMPATGHILAHSPDRGAISDALEKQPLRPKTQSGEPWHPYYIFCASSCDPEKFGMDSADIDALEELLESAGVDALGGFVDLFSFTLWTDPHAVERR